MFKNKVVWITGASSGIGEALALQFAAQGAKVILSARRVDVLETVKQKCTDISNDQNSTMVLPLDLTDTAGLFDKASQALGFAGHIDMLINNAGVSQRSGFLETEANTFRALFEVDVFGQIALTRAVLPAMIAHGSGHIVIMASVAGKLGVPFRTAYCAAKHAVMGFFDSLRTEVAHQNIQVTTITPGFIQTNISANALSGDGTPFGMTDPSIAGGMDVTACAQVIMRGFRKGKPEIAVGRGVEMHILWLKRLWPRLVFKLLAGQYKKMAAASLKKQS